LANTLCFILSKNRHALLAPTTHLLFPMKQLFLFLFGLSATTIFAQAVQRPNTPPVNDSLAWTLPQCIAYAQTHNIPVQQQQLNTQLAKADLRQSQGNFLPAVNGFASHTYQYGLTVDRFTNTFANTQVVSDNFYLDGRMTLFSGFQNYNQLAQSRYQMASAGFQTEQVKYELALSVMNAYLNVLFTDEQWTLARQQADVTRVQVTRTKIIV
jgi:outer membrane protein